MGGFYLEPLSLLGKYTGGCFEMEIPKGFDIPQRTRQLALTRISNKMLLV